MGNTFCKNCGQKIEDGLGFCMNCGTPSQKSEETSNGSKHVVPKKMISKKQKIIWIGIGALVLALIGTHLFMQHLTDSDRQLQRVYNAIVDGNGDALFKELSVTDDLIYNNDGYTAFLKENDPQQLHRKLDQAAQSVKQSGLTEIISNEDGEELFQIRKGKLLFYPTISIEPISTTLYVDTDMKTGEMKIEGHAFPLEGHSFTVDTILPGNYEAQLSGKNKFFESAGKLAIDHDQLGDTNGVTLELSDHSITFNDDPEKSIVYINGKSTKKTAKELGIIAPVFEDETEIYAVRDAGKGKKENSEKVQVEKGGVAALVFPSIVKKQEEKQQKEAAKAEKAMAQAKQEEENEEKISDASYAYSEFRDAYESALNDKDFDYVESYLLSSGEAYGELRDFVLETDEDYYYQFISNEVLNGEVREDGVHLSIREMFTFENDFGKVTDYDRQKEYILTEDGSGEFKVKKIIIHKTGKS